MPQRLLLPDGRGHIVGQPVEESPDAEQAVEDAQAALEDGTAEPAEPTTTPCVTAFTVYLMDDGDVLFSATAWADPQPARKPTFDEITFGAAVLDWHVRSYSYRVPGGETEGCVTAFTPYLTHDGRWLISADADDPLVIDREPTTDELVGALAVVQRDVTTQEVLGPVFNQFGQGLAQSIIAGVTQSVIGNMINMGKQAAEAQEAMKVAKQLEDDKKRRGGR